MQRRLITGKRKVEAEAPSVGTSRGKKSKTNKNHPETGKKPSAAQGNSKSNSQDDSKWPDYFKEALNTVLAFCTSRKQFATSFDSLRASVEGLLKRLLARVAEIKVLVPELLTFAYTPANHLKFNSSTQQRTSQEDVYSDYADKACPTSYDESDHVLVLEMDDSMVRKKKLLTDSQVDLQPLDPASIKQLIEKRNAQFFGAIDELLQACPDAEDPVTLLVALARDHIPLTTTSTGDEVEPQNIPDPENRRSIDGIVEEIYEQKWYQDQIKYRRTFDAKSGSIGTVDPPLSDSIRAALRDARKISTLYTHQAAAIAALSQGKDVIVSTSTASGKSVIYQVPLLRILEQDDGAKALFIYPTKALAQDQKAALEQLLACCPGLEHIPISTYDGDTPQDARPTIRDTASVLFTNIVGSQPWILDTPRFLKNLKLVAVDELHYYHDMLGSHVALVMRRLRRICAAVGNRHIRFVSCSATISRPKEHMKTIFGLEDVEAITQDEAPSGKKEFLLWRYPDVSKASPISEATRVMSYLMKRGIRVILFCKTRKSCELAMKSLRTTLSMEQRYDILDKVKPYRGGYQPSERRQIEQEAFSGRLLGLVATNALELGVDIGVLDAVIVCGFPVSVASFRQQIGRAGRRARDSLAIYVAEQSGTDSHYPTSDLVVNLESPVVIEAHLQCAALEMPLSSDDARWFGPTILVRDQEGWYHTHPKHLPHPAGALSIRGAEEEKYAVIDVSSSGFGVKGRILEETEVSRALFELYEGAIFLHQGKTFLVKEINHDSKQARLVRTDVGWITTPRDIDPIQTWRIREVKASPRRALYGIQAIRGSSNRWRFDMPPYENITTGISPWLADLRTECKPLEKEMKATESARKRPARLIFYDPVGRSIGGVAAKAFDHASDFLIHALEAVTSCDCLEGCENCILSGLCRKGNEVMSKRGALVVLKDILGMPLGAPEPIEDVDPRPLTVIEAPSVGIAEGVVVEKYDA
ncbi:P-loop containing nucleoside triphosphate hydrolase protein [Lactarius sanguifluus]|nr:P-loop containing nucleoside triphosphate hydrolase protein [Lactarius sanguifluus]